MRYYTYNDRASRIFSYILKKSPYYLVLILGLFCFFLALYTVVVFIDFLSFRHDIRDALKDEQMRLVSGQGVPAAMLEVYDRNEKILGRINAYNASNLKLNDCRRMEWLNKATVATEDRNFFHHYGISLRGILRAAQTNIMSLSFRQGGGSITQQLARNMFTSREKNLYRKLFETFIAFFMERIMTKEEILCSYHNEIYMGEGQIGAQQASWFYFNKDPIDLSVAEAAMLVGLFPSPSTFSPLRDINLSLTKQRQVLENMSGESYIDSAIIEEEVNSFKKKYQITEDHPGTLGDHNIKNNVRENLAPTVNEYVYNFVLKNLSVEELEKNTLLRVYTTIDYQKQRIARQTIVQAINQEREKTRQAYARSKKKLQIDSNTLVKKIQGVFISIDPQSGEILAVEGGRSPADGGLAIRPWVMLRQPGSSIKGFLYAVALDEDIYRAKSLVYDEPVKFHNYQPKNWNNKYLGTVPLAKALAHSINTVAVKTLEQIGVAYFRQKMAAAISISRVEARRRFPNNLSLALGSGELTPLELGQIYLTLINGGVTKTPHLITLIENEKMEVVYRPQLRYEKRILRAASCSEAIWLMSQVFNEKLEGTASFISRLKRKNKKFLNFPIAGKTGSVQMSNKNFRDYGISGYHDAWFVGLHPEEVNVIWLGQDQGAPIRSSGTQAAVVWSRYAQQALQKSKVKFINSKEWPKTEELNWFTEGIPPDDPEQTTTPQANVNGLQSDFDLNSGEQQVPEAEVLENNDLENNDLENNDPTDIKSEDVSPAKENGTPESDVAPTVESGDIIERFIEEEL